MDDLVIRHYLNKVPVEIREAVQELDTDQKWAIYIALTVDGNKYFNQLKKEFKANPNTIDKNLKALMEGGLIQRKVKILGDIDDRNKNYYTSTKLGEKLLANLYEVVVPPLVYVDQENVHIRINEPSAFNFETFQAGATCPNYESHKSTESIQLEMKGVKA